MENKVGIEVNLKNRAKVNGQFSKNFAKELASSSSSSKELAKNMNATSISAEKIKSALGIAFNVSEIGAVISIVKELAQIMFTATKSQINYISSLNTMTLAFGNAKNEAQDLIDIFRQDVGFNETYLTRQISKYKEYASAIGIASEQSTILSKNLLQLQADLESAWGVEVGALGTPIMTALSGTAKALRQYGIALDDVTLKEYANAMGISKSVDEMNSAEKVIVRYLTMERQMENIQGNLADTVNNVANQMRIFKEQVIILGRQIGGFLIPILKSLLPIMNGLLMAINQIVLSIMSLLGIDAEAFTKEFSALSTDLGGITDSLDGIESASNRTKKSLRGFDKLNNIMTPTPSSKGLLGGLGIDKSILDALKEYDSKLLEINNKAVEIKNNILDWFKRFNFNKLKKGFNDIAKAISPIADKYSKAMKWFLDKVLTPLTKWTIEEALPTYFELYAKSIEFFTTVLEEFAPLGKWLWEEFLEPIGKWTGDIIIKTIDRITTIIKEITKFVKTNAKPILKELEPIGQLLTNVKDIIVILWKDILEPFNDFMLNSFSKTASDSFEIFKVSVETCWKVIKPIIEKINEKLQLVKDMLENGIDKPFKKINDKIIEFEKAHPQFIGILELIRTNLEKITKAIKEAIEKIKEFFGILSTFDSFKPLQYQNFFEIWSNFAKDSKKVLDIINNSNVLGGGGTNAINIGGIGSRAEGGFMDYGELYWTRENGLPEMVGMIGNKPAVANNDQIVEAISSGVARANMMTQKSTNVTIVAEGDTSGLLDFINFKQKEKDRQYGLG